MMARPTILVELGCFNSKLRASGPNSSLVEAVRALSDRFRFRIIGEAAKGEETGKWHEFDGCERIAVKRGIRHARGLLAILSDTPSDLVVCNGFFDYRMTLPTLLAQQAGRLHAPLLLAPRGEFSPGALELNARRKQYYLKAVKAGGLLRGVSFQATDAEEAAFIKLALPDAKALIGPNVRRRVPLPPFQPARAGSPLRVAFASRIDRKKNLDWALRLLERSGLSIQFDIHGPVSDEAYWAECHAIISAMPANITVRVCGVTAQNEMVSMLAGYDLFLLPTRGENYGHAIVDALFAGTPVLIADTTPWRGLSKAGAGADLPLYDMQPWIGELARICGLSQEESALMRVNARRIADERVNTAGDVSLLAQCFSTAMGADDVRH